MVDDAPASPSPSPSPPVILACDTPPAYPPFQAHPAPAPNAEDESPPKKVKLDEPAPEAAPGDFDGSQLETTRSLIEDETVAKAKSVVVGDFGGEGMLMSGGWLVSAASESISFLILLCQRLKVKRS